MPNNVSDFIGPIAIVSPAWGEHGTVPDWTSRNDGFCSWERLISDTVWIAREDTIDGGRTVAGLDTIHVADRDGFDAKEFDAVGAQQLIAELRLAVEMVGHA
jgi:hypothetical protein